MSDEKSPYGKFSVADVVAAENDTYILQMGDDLFTENGYYAFRKEKAENLYDIIRESYEGIKKEGNEDDQKDAIWRLQTLRLHPLRIH